MRTRIEVSPQRERHRDRYFVRVRPQLHDNPVPRTVNDDLRSVVSSLWQKRWWVILTLLAALAAGFSFLMLATPRYEATAQLLIDPRGKQIVDGSVVPVGMGSSSVGADTLLIDSQAEIINSTAVLASVVREQGLETDSEFMIPQSGSMRRSLRNLLGGYLAGYEPELASDVTPFDVALERFRRRHVFVRRVGNTYVINVEVLSRDAEKAARLSNAIAASYLRDQTQATSRTTRETTDSLQGRIEELRSNLRTAETAVEIYRADNGLVGAQGLLVDEQQLQQLNARLTVARGQTTAAKSRFDQLKGLSARSIDVGATPEALESSVIANLRSSLARIAQRESTLRQNLGSGHPDVRAIQAERQGVVRLLDEELARIKTSASNAYRLAQSNEAALESELAALKRQASTNNQALVKLRELEREAQAARAVFETFLIRAKETSEQERLNTDNTRIISAAAVPEKPVYPATLLVALVSLVGGLGLGLLLAWLSILLGPPQVGYRHGGITIEPMARQI